MSERVHVALAVDHRCVHGCAVSMRSVLDNATDGAALTFHVVFNGLGQEDRAALDRSVTGSTRDVSVAFYAFDPGAVSRFIRSKAITHTAYARLYLGELLPDDVKRCIYVDCDLVFERDIVELWRTDLGGRTAGAADNRLWEDSANHKERLGLREARYFNSGVLLIDLDRWRARDVGRRATVAAERIGDRLVLHDQDALNHALQDDWTPLDTHWNMWVIHPDLRPDSPCVFHYMGSPKPWHADYDRRFQDKFFMYLDRTALRGWRPWNPAGIGAGFARLGRRTPYLPSVIRAIRQRIPSLSGHP